MKRRGEQAFTVLLATTSSTMFLENDHLHALM